MQSTVLPELRKKIDEIDDNIARLLEDRAKVVLQVKAAKEKDRLDIYSPARERQILERVGSLCETFPRASLERVFVAIISGTRSLIGELAVGYAGFEYSAAHGAAVKQFGNEVRLQPEVSVEEVFKKVELGELHYGLVPIEDYSSGLVYRTVTLFIDSPLYAIGEVALPATFSLVSKAKSISGVRYLYSDSISLSQCSNWLHANLGNVAVTVLEAPYQCVARTSENSESAAIVASPVPRLDLSELAAGIQNEAGGRARYYVIGQKIAGRTGKDKTSIVCAVKDRPGALRDLLSPFSDRGLTLTKIESKTSGAIGGTYSFVIDLIGHVEDAEVSDALKAVKDSCSYFRLIGSYPAAQD